MRVSIPNQTIHSTFKLTETCLQNDSPRLVDEWKHSDQVVAAGIRGTAGRTHPASNRPPKAIQRRMAGWEGPDWCGCRDRSVNNVRIFHAQPGREHPAVAATKRDHWRRRGVQVIFDGRDQAGVISEGLCGGTVTQAIRHADNVWEAEPFVPVLCTTEKQSAVLKMRSVHCVLPERG